MEKKADPLRRALFISLAVSAVSLSFKVTAFIVTGSSAALSDAAESVVHFFAVLFVVYGYWLSLKPPDEEHPYGHERVEYLSVGAEGAVIILAGLAIIYHAVLHAITGVEIRNTETGLALLVISALINLLLGLYLVRKGRRHNNMMVISNGRHTLTDVWTTGGVVSGLLLIQLTGWLFIDILVSLMVAAYIIHEAYKLLRYSVHGLMDTRRPEIDRKLRSVLEGNLPGKIRDWHHLRHRSSSRTTWVELHLEFEDGISLMEAHEDATLLERRLIDALHTDAVVTLHLEPQKDHRKAHDILRGANKSKDLDEFV